MADREISLFAQRDYMAPVPDTVLLNLANVRNEESSTKPKSTLFGPLVGLPPLSQALNQAAPPKDIKAVSPSVVQGWVSKSKESAENTTTLQALVNLKTSSLRLSPLSVDTPEGEKPHVYDAPHGLEFQYDCDAAKCKITVNILPGGLSNGSTSIVPANDVAITVYDSIFDGGFAHILHLEDGAILELAHYLASSEAGVQPALTASPVEDGNGNNRRSILSRKRLSAFPFKRRHQRSDVTGPALRVVDIDAATEPSQFEKKNDKGVLVTIRIEALDEEERPLQLANAQSTTLHIVRAGTAEGAEDTRHWVVQVVRRDATIGSHTFRLHDIYGLSSGTSPSTAPESETTPDETPSYPPKTSTADAPHNDDDMRSECVLCLSAPREVVLLPCRHLVACKDCAINMVEYGAGGQLVQPNEATEGGDAEAVEGAAGEGSSGLPTYAASNDRPATRPTQRQGANGRRKRRPKGWHCPVCRQPYTALLRISATSQKTLADSVVPTVPPIAAQPGNPRPGLAGMLASRPGFLRSLSKMPVTTTGVEHPLQQSPPEV